MGSRIVMGNRIEAIHGNIITMCSLDVSAFNAGDRIRLGVGIDGPMRIGAVTLTKVDREAGQLHCDASVTSAIVAATAHDVIYIAGPQEGMRAAPMLMDRYGAVMVSHLDDESVAAVARGVVELLSIELSDTQLRRDFDEVCGIVLDWVTHEKVRARIAEIRERNKAK